MNLSQMSPLFEDEEYCIRSFQLGSITIRSPRPGRPDTRERQKFEFISNQREKNHQIASEIKYFLIVFCTLWAGMTRRSLRERKIN